MIYRIRVVLEPVPARRPEEWCNVEMSMDDLRTDEEAHKVLAVALKAMRCEE